MKKILILIGCLLFLACGPKKVIPTSDRIVIDSTIVTKSVTERDTSITVPESSVFLKVQLSELTEKPISKKNGQATVNLKKHNDTIIAQADCSELELRLKLKDSLIETLKTRQDTTTYHAPCDDTGNWYDGILKTLGFIFLALLAIFSIWILIKYFTK